MMNENLFSNLNRWAIRQNENFTTEVLVYLLNHLLDENPPLSCDLLRLLTDGKIVITEKQAKKVKVHSQAIIDEGKPDIEISSNNFHIYVEVKIDSELGKDQLTRYRQALENMGSKSTLLVYLSRYPLTTDENGAPDVALRWYQIADWIESTLKKDDLEVLSRYLLIQFFDFLKSQNLVLNKVQSKVSEGLNDFRVRFGDAANILGRMRSFQKLDSYEELKALSNLLKLMKEAFPIIGIKPRLESGKDQGGWAGYVFNRIDSAFCVYYAQPETLVYETYNFKINPDKFDSKRGKLWNEGRRLRWKDELNLADTNEFFFFEKKRQLEVIESFLKQSYEYSRSLGRK
jgi:hypothetical protein